MSLLKPPRRHPWRTWGLVERRPDPQETARANDRIPYSYDENAGTTIPQSDEREDE